MNDSKIFIFANGGLRNPDFIRAMINPGDYVIAADGGGLHLAARGRVPDVVIGDIRAAGAILRKDDYLIAVDGGLRHLHRL